MNHLIQIRTLVRVRESFDSDQKLWCGFHESFDSDRDFGMRLVNHSIQIRTLVRVRESFDSDQNFGADS